MKPDDVRKKVLGTEIAYIPQAAMNALNPTQKIIRFIEDVIHAHEPNMSKRTFMIWPKSVSEFLACRLKYWKSMR